MSSLYWLFLLSGFLLAVTPGPSVLYLVARSVDQGRGAGLVSCLGIFAATLVHGTAAALGLSAILASSAFWFAVVKWAGVGYLMYLGVRTLLRKEQTAVTDLPQASLAQIGWDGFMVNLLNPKTTLFFFSFLPQFVDPTLGNATGQVVVLAISFALVALTTDSVWALVASGLGQRIRENAGFRRIQKYFTGGLYLVLGTFAAVLTRKT